jgi:hypothetical protein
MNLPIIIMVITSFQIDFLIVSSKNKNKKAKTHQNYKHTRNYDPQREQNTKHPNTSNQFP